MKRVRKRRRPKHRDRLRVGRSALVPFDPAEDCCQRHARRFSVALQLRGELQAWCDARGLRLEVTNEGHHWRIYEAERLVAQWWPSSAKLVPGVKFRRGVHVHDVRQLMTTVGPWLNNHTRQQAAEQGA